MKMRSRKTLKEYGLTEEMFIALYESQNGQCAICGVSEDELAEKYSGPSDWGSDRVLHIDHQRGARRGAYEGCFAADCNFDLEAFERGKPVAHPRRRGLSLPRRRSALREVSSQTIVRARWSRLVARRLPWPANFYFSKFSRGERPNESRVGREARVGAIGLRGIATAVGRGVWYCDRRTRA